MSDTGEDSAVPSAPRTTPPAKKGRGRPAKKSTTPETPQQKIERLEAELVKAREAKKLAEQQRDAIVGEVVVAHALAHDQFRRQLAGILRAEVKGKADLAAIAELLA